MKFIKERLQAILLVIFGVAFMFMVMVSDDLPSCQCTIEIGSHSTDAGQVDGGTDDEV
jgi:hypothetical protein